MKTRLSIILMLFSLYSYGQITEMLVDTNKIWSNLFSTHTGGPPPYYKLTTFVKFSGDTIINSNHYKKVLTSQDSLQSNYIVSGYIREDSSNKVFYRKSHDSTIRLLYDFNVKVGDTVNIGWSYFPMKFVVETVDSIYIYDKYLKRIVILEDHGKFGEQWIEGIGSLCGVLESGYFFIVGSRHELLCYYENDTLKYSNPGYPDCYYNTVGVNDPVPDEPDVNLYPNPITSTSIFSIENKQTKNYILEIYNLNGVIIKTFVFNDEQLLLHNKNFVPGLYFYRLIDAGKDIKTGKFIIK